MNGHRLVGMWNPALGSWVREDTMQGDGRIACRALVEAEQNKAFRSVRNADDTVRIWVEECWRLRGVSR